MSIAATANVTGRWALWPQAGNSTKGEKTEHLSAGGEQAQDSTFRISEESPIVIEGSKVSFYHHLMEPGRAYSASIGGKRYLLIRNEDGSIDIFRVAE